MENTVCDRALKRMSQIRLKFIDGSISIYCYIINSPKHLDKIRQVNKLASIMCNLESDIMSENEECWYSL